MKVQPVSNISMQAIYFPKKPENTYVADKKIQNAIKSNPFISKLSEQADIFVRYWNAKNVYYSMSIDIVDLQKKQTKVSMSYVTTFLKDKPNLSELDFISQIKEPNSNKKGNLLKKIMRSNRMKDEHSENYHMGFVGPHLVRKKLGAIEAIPGWNDIIEYGIQVQRKLWNINKETMEEITKRSGK